VTDWPYPLAEVPSPQIVATWTQLGLVRTELIPLWAAHWLVAGYDGEHLVYLAGLHGDDPWDVRDALPDALRECGVKTPSNEAAATVVLIDLARKYLDGQAVPRSPWSWSRRRRVAETVEEVLSTSGYSGSDLDMPQGGPDWCDETWSRVWGEAASVERLTALIREACEEYLRNDRLAT
jgi:hypothetical protein